MVEITTDDTFNIFKSKKFGYLGGNDFAVSDDGLTWSIIQHYTDLSLTNPSTALINGYYYIADDTGIRKTKDFNTFFDVNAKISDDKHSNLNNFEWFQDLDDNWYIKYNASTDTGTFTYYADFDETTDSFVNAFNQFVLPTGGASGLQYVRGKYYIWQSGDKLYRADNFTDKFEQIKTDIAGNVKHKKFSSVVSDNYLYVYFAVDGKTYTRSSKATNLIHWSEPVEVDNVELGSYFYNPSAISVYPDHAKVTTFDKVLKVTANGFKQTVPISCMVLSSLQVKWEQNGSYQISFTAFDDKSVSYTMLSEEADIEFNGQHYIVKQPVEDAGGGIDTKQITATHIYSEISRVRQRNTKTGTLTYSVQDVLSFYLDDKVANPFGFTYAVYGSFDKQQIENLGNSSGSDMLSKITEQWPEAIIYPDNKYIRVYTPQAFAKNMGGRIDYLNNSSEVKMTVDSTTITNQVKVFGKQIENTDDNATDNAPVKYYFEPFIVEDEDSIKQYGLHPMDDISDERFTDKNAMQTFAKGQLSPNPAVSIEVTMEDNEVPYAGEKRHLIAKPLNLETDLTVIGYTWYPFDNAQKNSLSFANLPASILKTQANINNRIRMVQLMAQQAINAAKTGTRNFVSPTDPMKNDNNDIRTGDIWTLPLLDKNTKSLVRSVNFESEDDSDTNETIYTDPEKMDKINVQFSIWNGSQWLELSNQRTTNKLNEKISSVASQVQEAQAGIGESVKNAQDAIDKADKAIADAGFATDTAKTAKDVADSAKVDVTQAKSDSATALTNAKDAQDNANTAIAKAESTASEFGKVSQKAESALTNAKDAQTNANTALDNAKTAQDSADSIKVDVDDVKGTLDSKADKTSVDAVTKRVTTNETNITQNAKDITTKASQTDVDAATKRVSTAETNITQNANSIKSKASQSDVTALTGRVSTAETNITQNAKDITSKASQTDVDTLTGRVKDDESEITQNAKDITSKVSSSDVQGMLDDGGYATQTWTGSQIDQKADEISSTVTSVSNKVDNLQIGGRNYLLGTANPKTMTGDGAHQVTADRAYLFSNKDYVRGKQMMFSVDVTKTEGTIGGTIMIMIGRTWQRVGTINVADVPVNTTKRLTFPVTVQDKENRGDVYFQTPGKLLDGSVTVSHVMMVEGTKPTDWTPAPEDMATVTALSKVDQKADSISSTVTNNKSDADTKFSNINQTIDGIQSTVKNKADSSTVTQLSNVVDSKVSTKDYNSEITQLADDINLRVTKDGLISQINQQAGGNTLIQVSGGKGKLYFDSSSVVFSGKAFIPDAAIASLSADKLDVSTARIGSGSNYIDMTGGSIAVNKGNTSTTLNGNNIFIGRNDSDNRYRWGTKIDRFGLSFGVPAKQYGSDSKWNYETQGYLSGDGWNYGTADMTGNGESGIVLGITSRQDWGNDNGDDNHIEHAGGDYFQLGKYLPTNNNHDLNKRTFLPALIYLASPINTVAGGQGLHVMSNLIIHDTGTMSFYGNGGSNNGIYFDKYGRVHGSPGSPSYRINDRYNNNTFAVNMDGSKNVWFGNARSDGGGSLYSANNHGWFMRNHDGSFGNVYAKAFIQKSTIDLKKNIEMADTDKLANDIYNMDVTTWNYKEETSQNDKHIGAVIGGDYHINGRLLSDDNTGVNTTSLTFALVAALQKQAKQISELTTELTLLKIKEQANEQSSID